MDNVTRMTELQSSAGTNMVLASVVILSVLAVLGVMVAYLRARLRDELQDRQQERAERQKLFEHVLTGNGDSTKPGLRQLGERMDQLGQQQVALRAEVTQRLDAGQERFDALEVQLGELTERLMTHVSRTSTRKPRVRAGAQ